jgi:bifunctional NMN adenylyltransferase/nudix hydrolase
MNPSFGVVVGRFQVHELHDAHMELFRQVRNRHQRVIVMLGCAPTGPTKYNPLDFETRRRMVQAKFPDFTVVPIMDKKTDEEWSKELDARISDIVQVGEVTLYGGRDSFVPHYSGKWKPKELDIEIPDLSGQQIRDKLTNTILESSDFRAGWICALQNMFPKVVTTVDVAILYNTGTAFTSVLLGKKKGEKLWRFIGGHADPKGSFEDDAKREAFEETGLDIQSVEYLGSFLVDDWRYTKGTDKIKTIFFKGYTTSQAAKANDDISEVKWFDLLSLNGLQLEKEHRPLLGLLQKEMYGN